MKLWQTRRHWEKFARTDPLWSILSDPRKQGNRWNLEEFFATGRAEVAANLKWVKTVLPSLPMSRALDFGCGAGRISQGLAGHFEAVTGVDIAENMLALANQHNQFPNRVTYFHNTRSDLSFAVDGSYDYVCSLITLQHMAPVYAVRYIAEFVRLLKPNGAALFQVMVKIPFVPKETFKFSYWPPTLWKRIKRLKPFNKSLAVAPVMEMHAIPMEAVMAAITNAGGRVVAQELTDAGGPGHEGYTFLVQRAGA